MALVSDADVEFFAKNGWLLTSTLVDHANDLQTWTDEVIGFSLAPWRDLASNPASRVLVTVQVAAWPKDGGEWLHYREATNEGPKLCRTENFTPFHKGFYNLLRTGPLVDIASALMKEPAVLYKEKINYKMAGGAGYSPHQDAPAYPFIDVHISVMVAVDDATLENGCLWVVDGKHQEILPLNERGCIRQDVVDAMTWHPVELKAGQTLFFHSRTPHRSGPNTTSVNRRALYPTYNALREGDLRDAYYKEKLAKFAASKYEGATVQVSLIGDFEGKRVDE